MLEIILIQPGATEYDDAQRIKGNLSFPLSDNGRRQAERMVAEISPQRIEAVFAAPCQSAQETAQLVAEPFGAKVRTVDELQNIDHGLWHGRLIEEIKRQQPKAYRQWQEHEQAVSPPEGESLTDARQRVRLFLQRLLRRRKKGVVALVVPEPLASVVRSELRHESLGDLWKSECDQGAWVRIPISAEGRAVSAEATPRAG